MTAFESGFFKMTEATFAPMTRILVLFVKSGFLNPEMQNKFFFSYLLTLKRTMYPAPSKEEQVDNRELIKITWSLINMQAPGTLSIPLIPKLLEQLSNFERPDQPLS